MNKNEHSAENNNTLGILQKIPLLQNKFFINAWIVFHVLIVSLFLIFLAFGRPLNLDADLFHMLPSPNIGKGMNLADEKLTELTGQSIRVLVSHEDFSTAKATAEFIYDNIKDSPRFKSVSLYSDMSSTGDIIEFVQKYRWNLLDASAVELINSDGGEEAFAYDALSKVYGAFSFSSVENLDNDPFMLGDYALQNFLQAASESGTAFSEESGVLAREYENRWYVMISCILSAEGAALASDTNAVSQIYDICNPLEKDGVRFVYMGTPFHSDESSSSASREITIISVVSLSAVIILLIAIFRNPLPIVYSVISIIVSVITAFSATQLIFGKIHLLTLVFGTSLIGSCIDYSLHYFVNWKANTALTSGEKIRKHLMTGLVLSLLSTEICYCMLVFAPFNLLKQMAVFSISGIFSSFLSVICIYPSLKIPALEKRKISVLKFYKIATGRTKKIAGRAVTSVLFAVTILTIAVFNKNLRVENNLQRLYTMEGRLADDTVFAAKLLQYSPSAWYIVTGKTAQETLAREEALAAKLKNVVSSGGVGNVGGVDVTTTAGGFLATSLFIPSIESQMRSRKASEKLLNIAENQYEMLGYENVSAFAENLRAEFKASENNFITPESSDVPEFLKAALESAWLGEIEGNYYSIVLPTLITDEQAFYAVAADDEQIYFENKMADMARDLDHLTRTILMLFSVAYVVIFIVLKFFYSWRETFKIVSVPLLIVLVICSVFAAKNMTLEFFSITGMILVFGLGLDYVIYMVENDRRQASGDEAKLEPFAILISFLTTAISFGALSLSGFVPVHLLGLSIFLGLTTAFLCTLF